MPNDNGRNQVTQWGSEIWNRIDKAVHDEMARARVGAKFIPLYGPLSPDTQSVPSDGITGLAAGPLGVAEGAEQPLAELSVGFTLTQAQVDAEDRLRTAVTLATRAANNLARAEDGLIFTGVNVNATATVVPRLRRTTLIPAVTYRSVASQPGLVPPPVNVRGNFRFAGPARAETISSGGVGSGRYGDATFEHVSAAYSALQGAGYYGPFAVVLPPTPYADIHASPGGNRADIPADRIKPLVAAGLFATGALPDVVVSGTPADFGIGLLVSVGGNTVDLAVGVDGHTAFVQVDNQGQYLFRVYERLALRIKDSNAIAVLRFDP